MLFNASARRVFKAASLCLIGVFAGQLGAQTPPSPNDEAPAAAIVPTVPSAPKRSRELGAANFYFTSGWTFGLPAVRAAVSVPRVGNALSPEKKTLNIVGGGMAIRAWKFVVPFVDLTAIDTGKASAQVGSIKSEVQADTVSYHAGVRLIGSTSRFRPYAQFGGGALHQNVKGTFYVNGRATPATASGSIGSMMFGGGVQRFWGRKWGSVAGFDGYRLSQQMIGGKRFYSRAHIGIFYQSKSAVE